jgi:hypothetical protein
MNVTVFHISLFHYGWYDKIQKIYDYYSSNGLDPTSLWIRIFGIDNGDFFILLELWVVTLDDEFD